MYFGYQPVLHAAFVFFKKKIEIYLLLIIVNIYINNQLRDIVL